MLAERAVQVQPESRIVLQQKAPILASLRRNDEVLAIVAQLGAGLRLEAGALLARIGRKEQAEALLLPPRGGGRFVAFAALGRVEESIAALSEADFGHVELEWLLYDPACDSIRDDPRVAQFLGRLGQGEALARVRAWRAAHPRARGN